MMKGLSRGEMSRGLMGRMVYSQAGPLRLKVYPLFGLCHNCSLHTSVFCIIDFCIFRYSTDQLCSCKKTKQNKKQLLLLATVRISFTYFRFAVKQLWPLSLVTTLNSNHHSRFFTPTMPVGLHSLQSQCFRLHVKSLSASLLWKIHIFFLLFWNPRE